MLIQGSFTSSMQDFIEVICRTLKTFSSSTTAWAHEKTFCEITEFTLLLSLDTEAFSILARRTHFLSKLIWYTFIDPLQFGA